MFLKTLTVGGAVACSALLGHYKSNCKDVNKTDHPARIQFPTRSWDSNWDCMKPDKEALENMTDEEKEGKITKAVRHLYLVRHGQYEMKDDDKDKILTELGREQAEITGERLKTLLGDKVTSFHISTAVRATETGNIILKHFDTEGKPVTYTDILVEGAPCQPVPEPEYWKPEPWEFNQDGARIEAAFKKYVHRAHASQKEDSHEVVVCHGNVIRYIVCRALQFDPEGWLRMSLANCSITHITIRPNGNVGLRGLGEKGHLTPEKMTYN